ncbi:hypothetical protein D6853_06415 [Butyrivibrio sp. X503]|uniref:hypothetical protein n=1 Tax=Butyrivibrio sp. X503 TaxID=2364878 RepID=UPI000EA9ABB6|nr:hypothetical protein [Butyrivibrio sp. X503]RKM56416.1 hypothetical protein D6853_06415 [Butyrivibrio sp. X503]
MFKRKNKSLALLMAFSLASSFLTLHALPITAHAETSQADPAYANDDTKPGDASTSLDTSESNLQDKPSEKEDVPADPTDIIPIPEEKKDTEDIKEEVPEDIVVIEEKSETPKEAPIEEKSETPKEAPIEEKEDAPIETPPIEEKLPEEAPKREIPIEEPETRRVQTYSTAYFYILNTIDADIPEEPKNHSVDDYSSAITVEEAIPNDFGYYLPVVDNGGSSNDLADDGFTANNGVLSYLHNHPSAEDIKNVVPSFDPDKQYVIWYVKKAQKSSIHVDGVIKTREETKEIIEKDYPNVSIEIYTTCEETDIEYDGKEHIIGGFNIVVKDLDNKRPTLKNIFNALGDLLTVEACAGTNGSGTYFSNNGINYWVNIDAAYVVASEIKTYTIPFLFNGKVIDPKDISVSYEKDGEWVKLPASIISQQTPTTAKINVKQRNITLEAGTTVKNYDGSTLTNDKVSITSGSLLEGHKLKSVVLSGSQSVIGSSKNEITSYMIVDENGKDVTSLYNVKCVAGKLEFVDGGNYSNDESANNTDPESVTLAAFQQNVIVKALEENDAELTVLGATKKIPRMGQTGDDTDIAGRILIIAASCTAIVILMRKKKLSN